jgi:hypothetical protein
LISFFTLLLLYSISSGVAWAPCSLREGLEFLIKTASVDIQINRPKFDVVRLSTFLEKDESELTNYIEQFFVGLLEGDGSITVDYISDRNKRVRIFIALNNLEENRFMLDLIVKHIGGRVAIERGNSYVT